MLVAVPVAFTHAQATARAGAFAVRSRGVWLLLAIWTGTLCVLERRQAPPAMFDFLARLSAREFYGSLSVALPALKAGSYQLILTVTDAVSGKSAKTTLPFEIGS